MAALTPTTNHRSAPPRGLVSADARVLIRAPAKGHEAAGELLTSIAGQSFDDVRSLRRAGRASPAFPRRSARATDVFSLNLEHPCPQAGSGVHRWLLSQANRLCGKGVPLALAQEALRDGSARCGRHVSTKEIGDAVRKAYVWDRGLGTRGAGAIPVIARPKWPAVNDALRREVCAGRAGLEELRGLSEHAWGAEKESTRELVGRLFPGNPLLCCGWSQQRFDTRPLNQWLGQLNSLQFVVPSTMTAVEGLTMEGRRSRHCLANTGARRFLICEFDHGTPDDHAGLLLHLGQQAPLVCVVHSGGKSLHGWFYVSGQPEQLTRQFFEYAVCLGADPQLWARCQFARMPGGLRNNNRRQEVLFVSLTVLNYGNTNSSAN